MKPIVETLLFLVVLLVAIIGVTAGAPAVPTPLSGLALVSVTLLPPLLLWCALAIRRAWFDLAVAGWTGGYSPRIRLMISCAIDSGTWA